MVLERKNDQGSDDEQSERRQMNAWRQSKPMNELECGQGRKGQTQRDKISF